MYNFGAGQYYFNPSPGEGDNPNLFLNQFYPFDVKIRNQLVTSNTSVYTVSVVGLHCFSRINLNSYR